jgi:poly(A) polymerase
VEIPGVPNGLLGALAHAAAGRRIALVGGAVRDALRHHLHRDPWQGLPDLDLVVEGHAAELAKRLPAAFQATLGLAVNCTAREHGQYGTVELAVDLPSSLGGRWLLDLASAREEHYPLPAGKPQVVFGALEDDLARRDFSVNAIALVLGDRGLGSAQLLDPFGGYAHLAERQLQFLHSGSLRDDPTRLVRGARYAARLGFELNAGSRRQAEQTLAEWPWMWKPGEDPSKAPPALGTRLRMELELLLEREPWRRALALLQGWGGFVLLDSSLQHDRQWPLRLARARRLGLPLLPALIAVAADPVALAERLQLPHRQHKLLAQLQSLKHQLATWEPLEHPTSWWCERLEAPGMSPEAIALAVAVGLGPRRPLLRWWAHWRHVSAPFTATELMAQEGLQPGPLLGERLRQLRAERLDQLV